MKGYILAAAAASFACAPIVAQAENAAVPAAVSGTAPALAPAPAPTPMVVGTTLVAGQSTLPANAEVLLSMNEEITSKKNRQGDTFAMTVVHDVSQNGTVIIPRGSRAMGEITWLTGKGAFGKSGKMNVELRYVEVGGRRIPIQGSYRQEGEGNTAATVGAIIAVGVFSAFVTGRTAIIPQGRELMAHTKEDLPFVMAAGAPAAPTTAPLIVVAPATVAATATVVPAVATTAATASATPTTAQSQ